MARYTVSEKGGGRETFRSSNWDQAVQVMEEWIDDGEYDESCYVDAYLCELNDNDVPIRREHFEILVIREPKIPPCNHKGGHFWVAPHEIFGGDINSPGVVKLEGTQTASRKCCAHCGTYKLHITESTPGTAPREPAITRYTPADDASLGWVKANLSAA